MKPVVIKNYPLQGVSLIEASAGTGKTWTIGRLYLRALLERKLSVQEILVVTFTHAATQELRGRIRLLLHALLRLLEGASDDPEDLRSLFGSYIKQDEALQRTRQALLDFDEAAIYSIHGFSQRAQTIYPLETGALLEQELIDDERPLQEQAMRDFWRQKLQADSGQDTELMLNTWSSPDAMLKDVKNLFGMELPFSEEALEKSLIENQKACRGSERKFVECYKNFDVEKALLKDDAWSGTYIKPASVKTLIAEIVVDGELDIQLFMEHRFNKYLRFSHLSNCTKKNREPEHLHHDCFKLGDRVVEGNEELLRIKKRLLMLKAARYVEQQVNGQKERQQRISFNDQITGLEKALERQKGLAGALAGRYPLAMVDEFQDTDSHQYQIFRRIYRKRSDTGLIMIGDPKQAIYSFRGGDVFTYQKARSDAGDRQFTLEYNFRSTPQLVEKVNALFSSRKNPFLFNRLMRFHPVQAAKKHLSLKRGNKEAEPLSLMLHPWTEKALNRADAGHYFARRCAGEIARLLRDRKLRFCDDAKDDSGKTVEARDIAVLVRTSREGALVREALGRLGIGSAMIQNDSVFATREAEDLALLLEFLVDPADSQRLHGLLSTDLLGLTAADIVQLQKDSSRQLEWLDRMKSYRQIWEKQGILSLLLRLFDDQETIQRRLKTDGGERQITNWMQLGELLHRESRHHASINRSLNWFLQQMNASAQAAEAHQLQLESDQDLVRILTMHKSKGLQYPIVFLPFAWSDKIDDNHRGACYRVHDDQGNEVIKLLDDSAVEDWRREQQAEIMRLFYVAITRAEYRCYIGWGHVSGAKDSAPARLLYADRIETDNKGKESLNIDSQDQLEAPWRKLGGVELLDEPVTAALDEYLAKEQSLAKPKEFTRVLRQQWRVSSFTRMALGVSEELADLPEHDALSVDAETPLQPAETRPSRFTFEKGARAGSFLHDLLEHQDFARPFDESELEQRCLHYGYEAHWAPVLKKWLDAVLEKDLGGFCLRDLEARNRIAEMEFDLAADGLDDRALTALLREQDYLQPQQKLRFERLSGFLKGYIDLVFAHQGRYYLLDYKSNHLGYRMEDYDEAACRDAMYEHHYFLQYLIYSLALHRHLRRRLAGYDYEQHFGGVRYLFLRGISTDTDKSYGLFKDRPKQAFIERLDALLGGGGA